MLLRAKQRGITPLEAMYDYLAKATAAPCSTSRSSTTTTATSTACAEMLAHPRALFSLGDAGAHVGTICDASFSTFLLTHWVRDRATSGCAARRCRC